MQSKINLGIIGKNFGYQVIYKSFLKNKKFKIRAFSFKSKKKNIINFPKNIKIYNNWKKLILDKKIKAIVIATPPAYHKSIIKFALDHNKHIFCEKPFTVSEKEANFVCNLNKKKNIANMVNYEFAEINSFHFFKKKILKKIKINKIYLNLFININKRSEKSWKENHSKGGGIMFNYICHAIYYLEELFGKINSIKTNMAFNKKFKSLKGEFFFKNNLSAKINIKAGLIKKTVQPIHQLKISSNKKIYTLETKLNSLADKFKLKEFDKYSHDKLGKILSESKNDKSDFRINPTFLNSKKFSTWILKNKKQKANFLYARDIHIILNKILLSSKKRRKIYIN